MSFSFTGFHFSTTIGTVERDRFVMYAFLRSSLLVTRNSYPPTGWCMKFLQFLSYFVHEKRRLAVREQPVFTCTYLYVLLLQIAVYAFLREDKLLAVREINLIRANNCKSFAASICFN